VVSHQQCSVKQKHGKDKCEQGNFNLFVSTPPWLMNCGLGDFVILQTS
jgi:hypothetical protein